MSTRFTQYNMSTRCNAVLSQQDERSIICQQDVRSIISQQDVRSDVRSNMSYAV